MIEHLTFSRGSKADLPIAARISASNRILYNAGLLPLTRDESTIFNFGPETARALFAISSEKSQILLNHGLFCRGFSELPTATLRYQSEYGYFEREVLPDFLGHSDYVEPGEGGACLKKLVWGFGFTVCDAILLRPPYQKPYLFHIPPYGLSHEGRQLLMRLPRFGRFIPVLGSESKGFSIKMIKSFKHRFVRQIRFPTGPFSWGIFYRESTDEILTVQEATRSIFKFPGFGE